MGGKQPGFCYGEPRVVEIINYSEPADIFGKKISEVNFTYAIYNFASWADSDTIKQAAEQVLNSDADPNKMNKTRNDNLLNDITGTITKQQQSIKTPLKEKAVLILTNDGWMHEKIFSQP